MEDILYEKIDRYLSGEMSPDEKLHFEAEFETNKELAEKFKMYENIQKTLRMRERYRTELDAIKNILNEPTATNVHASAEKTPEQKTKIVPLSKNYKAVLSVAASIIVIVLGYYAFFNKTQSGQQLADNYIWQNLTEISQRMSSAQDSLQKGIAAYNQKDYENALRLFTDVNTTNPANRDAKEYTGYVYLVKKDYEKALQQFEQLDKMNGKFNRGRFLQAVTYLQRNKEGDPEQAKRLLQQVISTEAGGSEEAEQWMQKLKTK